MYLNVERALDILSVESVKEICKITNCNNRREIIEKVKKTKYEALKYNDVLKIDKEYVDRMGNIDLWLYYISILFVLGDNAYKVKFNSREEKIFNELKVKLDDLKHKTLEKESDMINEIIEVYRNFVHLASVLTSGKNSEYVKMDPDISSTLVLNMHILSVLPEIIQNSEKNMKKARNRGILKVAGIAAASILAPGIGWTLLGIGATKLVADKTASKIEKEKQQGVVFAEGITNLFDFGFVFSVLVKYIRKEQEKFDI